MAKTVSIVSQKNQGWLTRGDVIKVTITVDATAERNWVVVSDPERIGMSVSPNFANSSIDSQTSNTWSWPSSPKHACTFMAPSGAPAARRRSRPFVCCSAVMFLVTM